MDRREGEIVRSGVYRKLVSMDKREGKKGVHKNVVWIEGKVRSGVPRNVVGLDRREGKKLCPLECRK